jgi:hypothetical protein
MTGVYDFTDTAIRVVKQEEAKRWMMMPAASAEVEGKKKHH